MASLLLQICLLATLSTLIMANIGQRPPNVPPETPTQNATETREKRSTSESESGQQAPPEAPAQPHNGTHARSKRSTDLPPKPTVTTSSDMVDYISPLTVTCTYPTGFKVDYLKIEYDVSEGNNRRLVAGIAADGVTVLDGAYDPRLVVVDGTLTDSVRELVVTFPFNAVEAKSAFFCIADVDTGSKVLSRRSAIMVRFAPLRPRDMTKPTVTSDPVNPVRGELDSLTLSCETNISHQYPAEQSLAENELQILQENSCPMYYYLNSTTQKCYTTFYGYYLNLEDAKFFCAGMGSVVPVRESGVTAARYVFGITWETYWVDMGRGDDGVWRYGDGALVDEDDWAYLNHGSTSSCAASTWWGLTDYSCDDWNGFVCEQSVHREKPVSINCPDGWWFFEEDRLCYKLVSDVYGETFQVAQDLCDAEGASLAMPRTNSQREFLNVKLSYSFWVDVNEDRSGDTPVYTWATGEQVAADRWYSGFPQDNGEPMCVVNIPWGFLHVYCEHDLQVICQRDADPLPLGPKSDMVLQKVVLSRFLNDFENTPLVEVEAEDFADLSSPQTTGAVEATAIASTDLSEDNSVLTLSLTYNEQIDSKFHFFICAAHYEDFYSEEKVVIRQAPIYTTPAQ